VSETLEAVRILVRRGEFLISRHGYLELAADGIIPDEVVAGGDAAVVVEDYANAERGPRVLVLQRDNNGRATHVLWGIRRGTRTPAVLVTAYRPDSA
jgi:hypothetical protein